MVDWPEVGISGSVQPIMDVIMRSVLTTAISLTVCIATLAPFAIADEKKHVDHPVAKYPVIPGESRLVQGSAEHGHLLLGALNCVGCHTASDDVAARIPVKQPPILGSVGSRFTPHYLRAYLENPRKLKPGTTMPDVFHASAAQSKAGAVDYLVHYLMSQGNEMKPSKIAADSGLINRGKALYHTVGCVACHSPQAASAEFNKEQGADDYGDDGPTGKAAALKHPSVPLGKYLGAKTTVEQLATFLLDPLKVRPSGRMPNVGLTRDEATAIAAYVLREQAFHDSVTEARVAGLQFDYYEGGISGNEPNWETLSPKKSGKVDTFTIQPRDRGDNFAFRFRGSIEIAKPGKYTFSTRSDDGSWLYIDGKKIVDNGGVHAPANKSGSVELTEGYHSIMVGFTEVGGGEELQVHWEGPELKKQYIPKEVLSSSGKSMQPLGKDDFTVDPQKAQFGSRMYVMLKCASCHQLEARKQIPPFRPMTSLANLKVDNDAGCLGSNVRKALPNYDLSDDQITALKAAINSLSQGSKPLNANERIHQSMAAMNCYGCHERSDVGGPEAGRAGYFRINGNAELGDEGRLPPTLSGIGTKLKSKALEGVLTTAAWRVRPYMATRMPQFGKGNVGHLGTLFTKLDHKGGDADKFKIDPKLAKIGRQLVGTSTKTKGFGCVNCHNVAGTKSLGVPAVDMATMFSRLRRPWFNHFLLEPLAWNKNTRMPNFFPDGKSPFKDILGGDVNKQADAMWHYLSMGKSMPLPPGMAQMVKGTELVPTDAPIIFRTFMTDASPRAIAVGNPENVHFAFDSNVVRLAKVWRGKFFDAGGTWNGRAGKFNGPLGSDVIDLPTGPAFAVITDSSQAWPKVDKLTRNAGGEFKGYRLDDELRPIFRYELQGVTIEEQPMPKVKPGGAVLTRAFSLSTAGAPAPMTFLAASGQKIEKQANGTWLVDGRITLNIIAKTGSKLEAKVREQGNNQELLVQLSFTNGKAAFEVEMDW